MVESQGKKVIRRQGDIRRFIDQQMHRHRKPALVFPVGYKVEGLDELSVNHAHQVVEASVRVGDAAEQGNFLFAHFLQMEIVGVGQPCDLRQVEGRQPDANTNQNGF